MVFNQLDNMDLSDQNIHQSCAQFQVLNCSELNRSD